MKKGCEFLVCDQYDTGLHMLLADSGAAKNNTVQLTLRSQCSVIQNNSHICVHRLCVSERGEDGTERLQRAEVPKVQHFECLGLTLQENGKCDKKVKRESRQDGKNISGVICDKRLAANIKKKVDESETSYNIWLDNNKKTGHRTGRGRAEVVEVFLWEGQGWKRFGKNSSEL